MDIFKEVWGFYWTRDGWPLFDYLLMSDLTGDASDEPLLTEAKREIAKSLSRVYDTPITPDDLMIIVRERKQLTV